MKSKQIQKFKDTEIGKIPTDWEITRLENVCTLFVPMRNKPKEFDGNIPWIRIEDLDGKFVSDSKSKKYVSTEITTKMNLRIFPVGTVLCSCTATIGVCAITQKKLVTNQQFIGIYPTDINNEFLYYYLVTQTSNLKNIAYGTVGDYITRQRFEDFQVILPSINEQNAIVKILSDLDSKIENLQQQNKVLEKTIQSIFKSWFVDFDGQTEFIDSELGKIPKGWDVVKLGKKLITKSGGTPSRKNNSFWKNGTVSWINSGKTRDFRIIKSFENISEDAIDNSSTKLIPKKTTVMAITGATMGQVSFLEIESCISQNVVAILNTSSISSEFIYFWIKHNIHKILSAQSGGAQQHINKKVVDDSDLLIPNTYVLQKFNTIAKTIFEKISYDCFQLSTVIEIRNSLLPKLMSGQIRVN